MGINRLFLHRCYLIGPMDHDRIGGREWREDIADFLISRGVIPFDPYNKPIHKLHMEGLEDDDAFEERKIATERKDWAEVRRIMKPIVAIDLRMVDNVDFTIVNLDVDSKPCGTYDEIFMAASQNKPVIIMCPQGKSAISPWMYGRLPNELFFESWDEVRSYIDHINSDEKIDLLDRWKFFDIEDTVRKIIKEKDSKNFDDVSSGLLQTR